MKRLQKLKRNLKKDNRFPYFISDLVNIRYLTGFTGSFAALVVDEKRSYFISDSRYQEYAKSILPKSVSFVLLDREMPKTLRSLMVEIGKKELFVEEHSLTLSTYLAIKKRLKGIKITPAGHEVNSLRMIKDDEEIQILKEAGRITDACVEYLLTYIKPGLTEWEVATEIELFYKKHGCTKTSFPSIVASGAGSSMPHYETSMDKKIAKGDVLLIDMGCVYKGYNSDLTRTIFINSIDPFIEQIYKIVKKAQEQALVSIKPGITTGALDAAARTIITDEGYGDNFGHSLGHGFGMEVHELPSVKEGDLTLKKNMTITIEPGIYVPGKGGVRIEDMVLITRDGYEIMTESSKDFIVI